MGLISSFPCTLCGYGATKAVSTNASESKARRRTRLCLKCNKTFITYEITANDYAVLESLKRWNKKALTEKGNGFTEGQLAFDGGYESPSNASFSDKSAP